MSHRAYPAVKRVVDVVVALAGLLVFLPLLAVAALAVRLSSPGPVLFRQIRSGRDGQPFQLLKLRSMRVTDDVGEDGLGCDDDRITPVGRVLRRWSLDEFPQLVNVLRGEMSLVGPRPTLPEQVARYDDRQRRRLAVRPGLTGLAQVSGRNGISWHERIEWDLRYVERMSARLDLSIVVRTLPVLLRGSSLYGPGGRNEPFRPVSES